MFQVQARTVKLPSVREKTALEEVVFRLVMSQNKAKQVSEGNRRLPTARRCSRFENQPRQDGTQSQITIDHQCDMARSLSGARNFCIGFMYLYVCLCFRTTGAPQFLLWLEALWHMDRLSI